jgi:hypothetical protein
MTSEHSGAAAPRPGLPHAPAGTEPVGLAVDDRSGTAPRAGTGIRGDIVEEWGKQSFPASDPPANW